MVQSVGSENIESTSGDGPNESVEVVDTGKVKSEIRFGFRLGDKTHPQGQPLMIGRRDVALMTVAPFLTSEKAWVPTFMGTWKAETPAGALYWYTVPAPLTRTVPGAVNLTKWSKKLCEK